MGNAPSSFDTYSLVVLVRPPDPTPYDEARLEAVEVMRWWTAEGALAFPLSGMPSSP